eukprot:TRINITY_DN6055_c0_g1_i5.p1 TRINITY_DN6055_c0_g1~~TRINITY_DN6055_c0_g1_i5.p1  ORF type:complete len:511 (+),score=81.78 TRINITY_DN6055_c0_g1_i5:103-1635(+)
MCIRDSINAEYGAHRAEIMSMKRARESGSEWREREAPAPIDPNKECGKLFLGGTDSNTTKDEIRGWFEPHCPKELIGEIILLPSKHCSFVTIRGALRAAACQAAVDGTKTKQGKKVRIRFAKDKCKLWVGRIPPTVTNEQLRDAFAQWGEVSGAWVAADGRGKSLQHGWVSFDQARAAEQCLAQCSNQLFVLDDRGAPLIVRPFEKVDPLGMKGSHSTTAAPISPRLVQPNSEEGAVLAKFISVDKAHLDQVYELKKQKLASFELISNEAQAMFATMQMQKQERERQEYLALQQQQMAQRHYHQVNAYTPPAPSHHPQSQPYQQPYHPQSQPYQQQRAIPGPPQQQSQPYQPPQSQPYQSQPYQSGQSQPYQPPQSQPYQSGQSQPYQPGQSQPYQPGQSQPYQPGQSQPYQQQPSYQQTPIPAPPQPPSPMGDPSRLHPPPYTNHQGGAPQHPNQVSMHHHQSQPVYREQPQQHQPHQHQPHQHQPAHRHPVPGEPVGRPNPHYPYTSR